jgi:Helix-hairpin-helix motif
MCALFATAARSQPAGQSPTGDASDEQGAALLVRMCNDCHDSAGVVAQRRTRADWQSVLTKMIENGAAGEPRDFEALFAYLCRTHGQVYINDAAADEIAMTLALSKKDAEAVVAHRAANGKFADFDAIRKVPEIDLKTLDAHKAAVLF